MLFTLTMLAGLVVATEDTKNPIIDNDFLIKCNEHCNAVSEYAKVAQNQATSEKVKAFATDLLKETDHGKKVLGDAFRERKLGAVAGTTKEFRDQMTRLKSLEGKEFDQAFLKALIEKCESHCEMCVGQTNSGKDPGLSTLAKDMHKTYETFCKQAKTLLDEVK